MRFSDLFTGKQRLESAKARVEAARAAVAAATDEGLQPAGALSELRKAEGLLAARKPEEAMHHATRAESVAEAVVDHGPAVRRHLAAIREHRDELVAFGLDADDADQVIAKIGELMGKSFVKVKGKSLPAPAHAAKVAENAATKYAARVEAYAEARNAIQAARNALEAQVTSRPHLDAANLRAGAFSGPYASLENAEASFDVGRYEEARDLADWASAMTKQVVERFGQALEDFEVAEAARDKLASEGIPPGALASSLQGVRERIEAGDLEGAAAAAQEVRAEAERLREAYGAAVLAVKRGEEAAEQARQWGFKPTVAVAQLEEASRLLKAGEVEKARAVAEAARAAAANVRETHRTASERIAAVRHEVRVAEARDPERAGRVETLLQEASRALEEGDQKGCQENLELAVFLLGELKRKA